MYLDPTLQQFWMESHLDPDLDPYFRGIADAAVYYGSFAILDPKAPFVDAPATARAIGLRGISGYFLGYGVSILIGAITAAAFGVAVDPHHRRPGGWDDTRSGQRFYGRDVSKDPSSSLRWTGLAWVPT